MVLILSVILIGSLFSFLLFFIYRYFYAFRLLILINAFLVSFNLFCAYTIFNFRFFRGTDLLFNFIYLSILFAVFIYRGVVRGKENFTNFVDSELCVGYIDLQLNLGQSNNKNLWLFQLSPVLGILLYFGVKIFATATGSDILYGISALLASSLLSAVFLHVVIINLVMFILTAKLQQEKKQMILAKTYFKSSPPKPKETPKVEEP